jgi:hypothetical protein
VEFKIPIAKTDFWSSTFDLSPRFSGESKLFKDHIHLSKNYGAKKMAIEVGDQLR